MKQFLKYFALAGIMLGSVTLHGQTPSHQPIEGAKTYGSGINLDSCRINILTVGYKLDMTNNQPRVYRNIKWKGKDSNSSCLSNEKFDLFLTIGNDTTAIYVYAGSSNDLVAGVGNYEWGSDPHTDTVPWNQLITKNFGTKNQLRFYSKEEAQAIWNQGFTVKNVKVVTEKGRVFILK